MFPFSKKNSHRTSRSGYRRGIDEYPRVSAITEILPGSDSAARSSSTAASRAKVNLINMKPESVRYVVNVALLFDVSASMPQEALDYAFGSGLREVIRILEDLGPQYAFRYNLGLFAFSTRPKVLLPFTYLEEIDVDDLDFSGIHPSGVTCTKEAMEFVLSELDRVKAEQDYDRIPREGTLLVCVTDGRPTDEEGYEVPLPVSLTQEVDKRNQTRKTVTLAFGMGRVDEATLLSIAPGYNVVPGENGESRMNPHAFIYEDPSYSDVSGWSSLMRIIALASSSSCTTDGFVSEPVFYRKGEEPPEFATNPIELPECIRPVEG